MEKSLPTTQLNQPGSARRVAALIEIHALLNHYAYLARDHLDWNKLGETFFSDAKVHLANGRIIPHSEMKNLISADKQPGYMRHHITAVDVHFSSDEEALVNTQWIASTGLSSRDHWGEWEDTLKLSDDGIWLISQKKITFEGMDPNGVAASMASG